MLFGNMTKLSAIPAGQLNRRARVIKALAHPSRLRIVLALERGERCVCELRQLVKADVSTVSKHLALMKRAGLLDERKAGLYVYYRLRVPCILRFLDCVDAVLEHAPPATRPRQYVKKTPIKRRTTR